MVHAKPNITYVTYILWVKFEVKSKPKKSLDGHWLGI
jgi:hypothetical protein